jgi:hypothetical protein
VTFDHDKSWSDLWIRDIKRIVGPYLLSVSPIEVDRHLAADFVLLSASPLTIGARIRRPGYVERYPFDFTLRAWRDSGAETEEEKVLKGLCDLMFYGHASPELDRIVRWWLLDMNVFRDEIHSGKVERPDLIPNGDGTYFRAYDVRLFSRGLRRGASGPPR